ncbi:MAG: hypothetical protein QXS02_05375 [Candidatus Thermoplasmatota archaeon]
MIYKSVIWNKCLLLITILTLSASYSVSSAYGYDVQSGIEEKLSGLLSSESTAVVLTTDYLGSSSLSFIDTSNCNVIKTGLGPTNGDDVVRYYDGRLYTVNRFGFDRIDVFDAFNYTYLYNFSTGIGSNPQDIVFISPEKAYVSCYDKSTMLIVNPSTGEYLGYIDLSSLADSDGIPEMQKMTIINFLGQSRVYVNIQRLDRSNFFAPTDKSFIVELDAQRDKIKNVIVLNGKNPTSAPIIDGYNLIVTCPGSWFNLSDGGVEYINLLTKKTRGFIVSESELNSNIIEYDYFPHRTGVIGVISMLLEERMNISFKRRYELCLISDQYWHTKLLSRSQNELFNTLYETDSYSLTDIAVTRKGKVFLCDRSVDKQGVHVFDIRTGERLTNDSINVGSLPPATITLY